MVFWLMLVVLGILAVFLGMVLEVEGVRLVVTRFCYMGGFVMMVFGGAGLAVYFVGLIFR